MSKSAAEAPTGHIPAAQDIETQSLKESLAFVVAEL